MKWAKQMDRYNRPQTPFYFDPSYSKTAGHGVDFGLKENWKMASIMGRLNGKAIVSLYNHHDIRRIFAKFQMDAVPITYRVARGSCDAE